MRLVFFNQHMLTFVNGGRTKLQEFDGKEARLDVALLTMWFSRYNCAPDAACAWLHNVLLGTFLVGQGRARASSVVVRKGRQKPHTNLKLTKTTGLLTL